MSKYIKINAIDNLIDAGLDLDQVTSVKIEDLKGKRIAVGPDGSGTEANTRQILQEYGLTYQDISPLYLPFAQAVSALLEDKVDVIFVTAGVPTVAIETLAQKNKLRMIGISEDKIQSLMFKYPFYSKISINQATYDGVTQNINSIAVRAMLVANNKINAQDGYDITKAILNNAKKLLSDKVKEETDSILIFVAFFVFFGFLFRFL